METDYNEPTSSETSKYNEAGLQILRLNDLWLRCELYANNGSLIKWKFTLDSIWRELFADVLRGNNSSEYRAKNIKLLRDIAKAKAATELYFALANRHEFLKEIQNSVGKGTFYVDSDADDFD